MRALEVPVPFFLNRFVPAAVPELVFELGLSGVEEVDDIVKVRQLAAPGEEGYGFGGAWDAVGEGVREVRAGGEAKESVFWYRVVRQ